MAAIVLALAACSTDDVATSDTSIATEPTVPTWAGDRSAVEAAVLQRWPAGDGEVDCRWRSSNGESVKCFAHAEVPGDRALVSQMVVLRKDGSFALGGNTERGTHHVDHRVGWRPHVLPDDYDPEQNPGDCAPYDPCERNLADCGLYEPSADDPVGCGQYDSYDEGEVDYSGDG